MKEDKQTITKEEAFEKAATFCAYQERCRKEVMEKISDYGLPSEDEAWVVAKLEKNDFLNEERFAKEYVRGKFKLKKWGKWKLEYALREKNIPTDIIRGAMDEIDSTESQRVLEELLVEKNRTLQETDRFKQKDKLYKYAVSKGYEPDKILSLIDKILL